MLTFITSARKITMLSVFLRMFAATICGGAIGLERSSKNRPAGLRTHMLVAIGSAAASLTGHYLYLNMELPADITRLGAQVITGLGFIGAGTIVVTRKQTVKGLTTAAGLWATGVVGLAIGAGFYEGAVIATILILFVEITLSNLGHHIQYSPEFRIRVEYNHKAALDRVLRYCKDRNLAITGLQIHRAAASDTEGTVGDMAEPEVPGIYSANISLRAGSNIDIEHLLEHIRGFSDVVTAEQ